MLPLSTGTLLDGRFEILSVASQDSTGVLYTARHLLLNKKVKLKLLHRHLEQDDSAVKAFQREASEQSGDANSPRTRDMGIFSSGEHYIVWDHEGTNSDVAPESSFLHRKKALLPIVIPFLAIGLALLWVVSDPIKKREISLSLNHLGISKDEEVALRERRDLRNLLESQHRFAEAAQQGELILQIVFKRDGPSSPAGIGALGELGDSYARYGNATRARELYEKALSSAAAKMEDLKTSGRKAEQLPFLLLQISFITRLYGPQSEALARALFEEGFIYEQSLHDKDKAYQAYEQSWSLAERFQKPNPELAWSAY